MLRLSLASGLLGVLALAGSALSQNVTDVSPASAAVGTTLAISGTGFGVAKPKVLLVDTLTGKKYTLKVVDYADTVIHATISKAVLGDLQLQVIVKGAPAAALGPAPVTIEAPVVASLSASSVGPDGEFTIYGDFFGIKKGKIRIGGQNAKVLSWAMNEIHLLMPKKLFNGSFPIVLDNKLGVNDSKSVTMVGSPVQIGKAMLDLAIDGTPLKFKFTPGVPVANHLIMVGVSATNPSKNLQLIIPFNPVTDTVLPKPVTTGTALLLSYIETGKVSGFSIPPTAAWTASGVGVGTPSVTITAASGGQVAGTVDSWLELQFNTFNSPKPGMVHLTGSFICDL